MTPELVWLTLTALLAGSLWIPFVVGVNTEPAGHTPSADPQDNPFLRPPEVRAFRPWVHRAWRAHQNLLETLVPFAALVLIAHLAGVSTNVTVWASVVFFWLRLFHAVGMISGKAQFPLRPIVFTASWMCTVAIGVQLLLA